MAFEAMCKLLLTYLPIVPFDLGQLLGIAWSQGNRYLYIGIGFIGDLVPLE